MAGQNLQRVRFCCLNHMIFQHWSNFIQFSGSNYSVCSQPQRFPLRSPNGTIRGSHPAGWSVGWWQIEGKGGVDSTGRPKCSRGLRITCHLKKRLMKCSRFFFCFCTVNNGVNFNQIVGDNHRPMRCWKNVPWQNQADRPGPNVRTWRNQRWHENSLEISDFPFSMAGRFATMGLCVDYFRRIWDQQSQIARKNAFSVMGKHQQTGRKD